MKRFNWLNKLAPYEETYRCSEDCKQSGCPTHIAKFKLNSVVDIFTIELHDKTITLDEAQMALILDFAERLTVRDERNEESAELTECCKECKCRGDFMEVEDGAINVACSWHDGDCCFPGCDCHKTISDERSEESVVMRERTRIIKALEGLRAEIIEKIIGDYDEALSLEEIGYLTKDRVKQLKDKWL